MKQLGLYLLLSLVIFLVFGCAQDSDVETPNSPSPVAESTEKPNETPVLPSASATPDLAPTSAPTETPVPTASPTATAIPTGPITVCTTEPPSLYLYGPYTEAAAVILEAIYDGPIDTRSFGLQPVILEKIPSIADGDARLDTVDVEMGDLVLDADGNVARLRPGIAFRPAGCNTDECVQIYGQPGGVDPETEIITGTVQMDQLSVSFKILPDLNWSDGEPLTAHDSVFSYEVAQTAQLPPRQQTGKQGVVPARRVDLLPRTASYVAEDESVVTWTGVPGFRDPYYQGNFFSPLPRHRLDGMENSELQQAEISARLPLGWGPYMLSEWSPGDRLVADRNPYYVGADDGRPYFDQVIFRFVGAEEIGLVDELIGEGCDLIAGTALDGDYETYLALEQQGAVRLHSTPSSVWEHLDFGIDPVPQYDWRGDYFQDPRMRQATAYCLNREAIADEIMAGLATVLNAYIPPAHPLYATVSASDYPYEPATGSALLDQVGWRDTNGDGVREAYGVGNLADGTTLVFNYVTTTSELRQRVAEMVANDLSQCGMRVNIIAEPVPPETFFGTSSDSPIFGRSFDVTSFAWLADMLPPCHLFLSSEIPTSTNGWSGFNVGGYNNPNYDAACNSARRSLPGTDEFVANHREALRIFIEELPAVPLFTHVSAAVSRPDIEGVIVDPTESAVTWNLENFRLRE